MAKVQKAMVAGEGPSLTLEELPMPQPAPNQVLVRVSQAAQNPTDVQSFDAEAFGIGAVYGCDFVGEVVELGSQVSRLAKGDIVAGLIWGGEHKGLGAYSHYTLADERISFKVPEGTSNAAAATVPLAAATAWLSLFSLSCLNIQRGSNATVLIWGGSSSVGQYAIQLAKLQSLKVVTVASPKNFDLLRSLGADHVFDYSSKDVIEDIKAVVGDLRYVFDTIGSTTSSELATSSVTDAATLCTVRPGRANTENVSSKITVTDVLVWTAFPIDHSYGKFKWPASQEDHELSAELFEQIPGWMRAGKLRPNAVISLNGLESVPDGFDLHRQRKISAQKVVYDIKV